MLGNKLLNIHKERLRLYKRSSTTHYTLFAGLILNIPFAKYHIWNKKGEGFPNMVLSTETFNQSVRTEYSEAVNARYTFQPLWVSDISQNGRCHL